MSSVGAIIAPLSPPAPPPGPPPGDTGDHLALLQEMAVVTSSRLASVPN